MTDAIKQAIEALEMSNKFWADSILSASFTPDLHNRVDREEAEAAMIVVKALAALRAEQEKPSDTVTELVDRIFVNVTHWNKEGSEELVQSYGDKQWAAGYEAARGQIINCVGNPEFQPEVTQYEYGYSEGWMSCVEEIRSMQPEVKQ